MAPKRSRLAARNRILYAVPLASLRRWMAQEPLTTFQDEIGELALIPGIGGIFDVRANGDIIWSRKTAKRCPDIKELKQFVRDHIAPGKEFGHSDH